uniref:Uncharacterized protein n=1 Tax=Iconisemion striatum TaxID=60296 RepID=A0A1A7XWZ4_9TELE
MEVDECEVGTLKLKNNGEIKIETDLFESSCNTSVFTNEVPSKMRRRENISDSPTLKKRAVVLLTRLPENTVSALQPPTPQQFYSEAESHGSSDSDRLWEPGEDSDDSDFVALGDKKKKLKNTKGALKRVSSPVMKNNSSNSNDSGDANNSNKKAESGPIIVSSAFAHSSNETTKVRPDLPEVEVTVDMMVLARRRAMRWQRGKIVEIVAREDGRTKYKVSFDEKGKSLVSGHHMAFADAPKLEQLYVGARVVIQSPDDAQCFQPGILSELPSRKNRLRFLVFLDDHTSLYASLPSIHLVCRPLEDNLDDIPDSPHKCFMKQYLKNWPYPHLTHYKEGQSINVELNGTLQVCTVEVVDCSLIQVVFQEGGEKEWIHRGSVRLEHMAKFLQLKEKEDEEKDNSES